MANFSLNKTSGSGNSTVSVTPGSYAGRGPVTGTVTIKTAGNKTDTVSCSKHYPLTRTAEVIGTSSSVSGTYTTVTPSSGAISVANSTATYVKISSTANAKSIVTSGAPSNVYVKVGTLWLQTDGSLGSNQVSVANKTIAITSDPGRTSTYALEVIYQIPANNTGSLKSHSLGLVYGGTNYPTSDSDKLSYALVVNQPAGNITYGKVVVNTFSYPDIGAGGGNSTPSISASVTYGYNGATSGGGTVTSGFTYTYTKASGSASLNTNNGVVTAASKGTTASAAGVVATINVVASFSGATNSDAKSAAVTQNANTAGTTTYSDWTSTMSANPTTIAAAGGTSTISSSCTRVATTPYTSGESTKVTQTATASYSSNQSWLTISGSTATASANNNTSSRSATVSATFTYASATVTPTSSSVKSVNITQSANTKNYANPLVSLSYSKASAAGSTLTPTLSYSQTWGWGSSTDNGGVITTGGSVSYKGTDVTANTTNGQVSVASLGTTVKAETKLGSVTATVTLNGKSGTASANIVQEANATTTITYGAWGDITVSASPNLVANTATTSTLSGTQSRTRTQNYTSGATSAMSNETNTTFTWSKVSGDAAFTISGNTVSVTANDTVSSRSAVFRASANSKTKDITVTQNAGASTLTVSPTSLTWDASDTTAKTITITSNDSWTVSIA